MSVKKNFYSDNVSGAAPEILEAIIAANAGDTAPYGADPVHRAAPGALRGAVRDRGRGLPRGHRDGCQWALRVDRRRALRGHLPVRRRPSARQRVRRGGVLVGGKRAHGPAAERGRQDRPRDLARMVDEAGARSADVPPRAVSLTQATEVSTVYTPAEVRALPRPRTPGACGFTWTAPASPMPSLGSAARRPRRAGRRVSTFSPSAPPRTGRSPPKPSSSSTAPSPRPCATAAGAAATSSRRCGSCPLSSRPSSPRTSGCGTPATPMPWPSGFARAWRRSPACGSGPDRDQLRPRRPAAGRLGRARGRGLQLLPARRAERGRRPDRLRLRHEGRGRGRPDGDRPPVRGHSTGGRPSGPRDEVTAPRAVLPHFA